MTPLRYEADIHSQVSSVSLVQGSEGGTMGGNKSKESKAEDNNKVAAQAAARPAAKEVDSRLPFENYRQVFQLKNSWKAITRAMEDTSKECMYKFFKKHPEYKAYHKKLGTLPEDHEELWANTDFEEVSLETFEVIGEVMDAIENVDVGIEAIKMAVSKSRKDGIPYEYFQNLQEPFMDAVKITLGDRYNESTERNFRFLWQYIMEYIEKCYNG